MSTQLYYNWLSTSKVKCYLEFNLPNKINLPSNYTPKLLDKANQLHLDFSLEKSILSKRQEKDFSKSKETSTSTRSTPIPTTSLSNEQKQNDNTELVSSLTQDLDSINLSPSEELDMNLELKAIFTKYNESSINGKNKSITSENNNNCNINNNHDESNFQDIDKTLIDGTEVNENLSKNYTGECMNEISDSSPSTSSERNIGQNLERSGSNSRNGYVTINREDLNELNLGNYQLQQQGEYEQYPSNKFDSNTKNNGGKNRKDGNNNNSNSNLNELEVTVDLTIYNKFLDMGFEKEKIEQALIKFNNREELAIDYLLLS